MLVEHLKRLVAKVGDDPRSELRTDSRNHTGPQVAFDGGGVGGTHGNDTPGAKLTPETRILTGTRPRSSGSPNVVRPSPP